MGTCAESSSNLSGVLVLIDMQIEQNGQMFKVSIDTDGFYSSNGQTPSQFKKECNYMVSAHSLGYMFAIILDYVSYIDPQIHRLGLYLDMLHVGNIRLE